MSEKEVGSKGKALGRCKVRSRSASVLARSERSGRGRPRSGEETTKWERERPRSLRKRRAGTLALPENNMHTWRKRIEERGKPDEDGWSYRGYLPHYESEHVTQMVTFRLTDSLPRHAAVRLASEPETDEGNEAYRERIEAWLDAGHGSCVLRNSWAAEEVKSSLLHFDGERYRLHAWVIMPNHGHILVDMIPPHTLGSAVEGWKSYTARRINERLGRTGPLWQRDYWDRYIRNERHYGQAIAYIMANPVKAGLVANSEEWPFSWVRTI